MQSRRKFLLLFVLLFIVWMDQSSLHEQQEVVVSHCYCSVLTPLPKQKNTQFSIISLSEESKYHLSLCSALALTKHCCNILFFYLGSHIESSFQMNLKRLSKFFSTLYSKSKKEIGSQRQVLSSNLQGKWSFQARAFTYFVGTIHL